MKTRIGHAALAVVTSATMACSFAIDTVEDDWTPAQQPKCESSNVVPTIDGLVAVAGLGIFAMVVEAEADCGDSLCGLAFTLVGIPSAVVGLVYGIAALSGRSKTRKCRDAFDQHDRWLTRDQKAEPREHEPDEPQDPICRAKKDAMRAEKDPVRKHVQIEELDRAGCL